MTLPKTLTLKDQIAEKLRQHSRASVVSVRREDSLKQFTFDPNKIRAQKKGTKAQSKPSEEEKSTENPPQKEKCNT